MTFLETMKRIVSAFLWVCIIAILGDETEAYANKLCYPNFNACNAACASTCPGKGFKCKMDVENCNDQLASLIKTCSDPFPSNSCPKVCEIVINLRGLQEVVFVDFPTSAIANIPGSFMFDFY